jgi:hypothetical protein
MSFLVLFNSWERFLESSFEQYLILGERSLSRIRTRAIITDIQTARDLIRSGKNYADWSDVDEVRKRASLFLRDGKPFEIPLVAVKAHLERMKTIRNRIAHSSQHADEKFARLLRQLSGYSRDVSAGAFLLASPPSSALPASASASAFTSAFQMYASVLLTAASTIVR